MHESVPHCFTIMADHPGRLFAAGIFLVCLVIAQVSLAAGESSPRSHSPLWNDEPVAREDLFASGHVSRFTPDRNDDTAGEPAWPARWTGAAANRAWTELALELIVKYQQNPLRAARVLALLHTAMHDALVLAGQRELRTTERLIALHRAAGLVLHHLYPQETFGRLEGLGIAAASAAAGDGAGSERFRSARESGERAAALAISRSLRDGAGKQWPVRLRPKDAPGRWRATPPLNIYNPSEALAGEWRTWVLHDGGELQSPPPPLFDSPAYRKEVEEVLRVARALTADQKAIADRWNLGQGTVTPAGVWNLIALDLIRASGVDSEKSAEVLAALNVAMMDAFIACWRVKYSWWTERPVTAIRDRLDPSFLPHLVTPAFPSYVSGHAAVSGAAEVVLAAFFPDRAARLREQSEEAALSRLYGGIHFRSDSEEGLKLGRRVGERVLAHPKARGAGQRAGTTTR